MLPVVIAFLRTYAPIVLLPVTMTAGYIGYKCEWWIKGNKDQANDQDSILLQREERRLKQITEETSVDSDMVIRRKTIFSDK